MTPSGIEPATCQLVAHASTNCATRRLTSQIRIEHTIQCFIRYCHKTEIYKVFRALAILLYVLQRLEPLQVSSLLPLDSRSHNLQTYAVRLPANQNERKTHRQHGIAYAYFPSQGQHVSRYNDYHDRGIVVRYPVGTFLFKSALYWML